MNIIEPSKRMASYQRTVKTLSYKQARWKCLCLSREGGLFAVLYGIYKSEKLVVGLVTTVTCL